MTDIADYSAEAEEEFEALAPLDQQEVEEDLPRDKMGDPAQSVLFNTDWTVSTIVQQIERGNIDLNPQFQRRSAWDPSRRSKLIESLIIGLPIPNIVLAEAKGTRGKYIVIDGKQRLSTMYDFLSDATDQPLTLRGLGIRTDLNNLNFGGLKNAAGADADFLENVPIRTVVIRNWPSDYFLYVIFDRLNSGSLPLSPQELRRALQPGPFLDYVDEYLANSKVARDALGLRGPDRRMRDSELVLRYIAFEHLYPHYDGDFKNFLDEPVKYFNLEWENRHAELDVILARLNVAMETSSAIFSRREIFRKWNGERFENRINRALFDSISRYFGDPEVNAKAMEKKIEVVELAKRLCVENGDFKRAIELTTKSPQAVGNRLTIWGESLATLIGMSFDKDRCRII